MARFKHRRDKRKYAKLTEDGWALSCTCDCPIWQYFKQNISGEDLDDIANSDYGIDYDQHLNILKKILTNAALPKLLAWKPREVLCLTRWNRCESDKAAELRGVLFSCCILLAASENPESSGYLDGQVENIGIAIDAAARLGHSELEYLCEFLMLLVPVLSPENEAEDYLYFHLGVYLLQCMLEYPEAILGATVDKLIDVERRVASEFSHILEQDIFSYANFTQRIELWNKYYRNYCELLENKRESLLIERWW